MKSLFVNLDANVLWSSLIPFIGVATITHSTYVRNWTVHIQDISPNVEILP